MTLEGLVDDKGQVTASFNPFDTSLWCGGPDSEAGAGGAVRGILQYSAGGSGSHLSP